MYPIVPREDQPMTSLQIKPFSLEQIRRILVSRAKNSRERRMFQNCDIEAPEFYTIGVCKIAATIEERCLGKNGHEEIDETIEDSIWSYKPETSIKLNKIYRGQFELIPFFQW